MKADDKSKEAKRKAKKGNDIMNKFIAVIAAVMMIVAIPIGLAASDADADTGVTGTYSVYAYDGSAWSSDIVGAYDAAQAVQASDMWNANTDSMVAKYIQGDWVTYNYTTYGNITTFMGKANTATEQWNVFIFNAFDEFLAAEDCLGSYKCFSDYDLDHQTANIVLYFGSSNVTADDVKDSYDAYGAAVEKSEITNVTNTDDYKVTFTLSINYDGVNANISGTVLDINGNAVTDTALKTSTVTIVGYGSDCYLALKDAVGSANITGEDTVPGQGYNAYGWMGEMFGLGTVQTAGTDTPSDWTDDKYAYWCIYDDAEHLADFVLGAYSPLACAGEPFGDNTISLIYEEVTM